MAFTDIEYISKKYAAEIEAWRQPPVQKSWDWIARRVSELENIRVDDQPTGSGLRRRWLSENNGAQKVRPVKSVMRDLPETSIQSSIPPSNLGEQHQNDATALPAACPASPVNPASPVMRTLPETSIQPSNSTPSAFSDAENEQNKGDTVAPVKSVMPNSPLTHAPTPNLPDGIPDPLSIITLTGSPEQQKADADFMRRTMALYGHRLAD